MEVIDKLALIYIKDKRILITRSQGKDTWYIPGGKREESESDHQALIREIKEELSVDIVSETLQSVGVFKAQAHGKAEGVIVQMTCYSAEFTGELIPAAEIEEMNWFEYKDRDKVSPVDQIIFDWLKERDLII